MNDPQHTSCASRETTDESRCLVGGTSTRNNHTLCHQAENLWKVSTGGARVDVRQYDRTLVGADYVAKCLVANAYELNKYSFANTATLSASILSLIAAILLSRSQCNYMNVGCI